MLADPSDPVTVKMEYADGKWPLATSLVNEEANSRGQDLLFAIYLFNNKVVACKTSKKNELRLVIAQNRRRKILFEFSMRKTHRFFTEHMI
ncbi:hypothetical protein EDM57_15355 [Brevibacillus gelatini]|uniref:Uncharacterized protein n=1 Tax=Brevibacillus gelatini TaxID=1655277 RepID=A0A3M8AVK4_9BACL|nr:hypothetical protein [Brevibacillus gelatini]RNB55013.1 hypothetical protein EDM57_15355 [Brevibacillus gelatini]